MQTNSTTSLLNLNFIGEKAGNLYRVKAANPDAAFLLYEVMNLYDSNHKGYAVIGEKSIEGMKKMGYNVTLRSSEQNLNQAINL